MAQDSSVRMTEEDAWRFISENHRMSFSSNGPRGFPHVIAVWYVVRGRKIAFWSFEKSQKIRNIERDQQVSGLIEAGTHPWNLRGVLLECRANLVSQPERVRAIGAEVLVAAEGMNPDDISNRTLDGLGAPKRIGVELEVVRLISWDHRQVNGGWGASFLQQDGN